MEISLRRASTWYFPCAEQRVTSSSTLQLPATAIAIRTANAGRLHGVLSELYSIALPVPGCPAFAILSVCAVSSVALAVSSFVACSGGRHRDLRVGPGFGDEWPYTVPGRRRLGSGARSNRVDDLSRYRQFNNR